MKRSDYKYTKMEFGFDRFNVETYEYVRLPYESSGKVKVLFVLDHMPSEDLNSGRLLSGITGDLFNALIAATKKLYHVEKASFSWLACSYNAFKSYGKSDEFRQQANAAFTDRLNKLICNYQPTYVVAFGTSVMKALLGDKIISDGKGRTRYSYWLGVPVAYTAKSGKAKFDTTVVSNISLNDIIQGDSGEASLLGYMCKCLAPIFGKTYTVDSSQILSEGCVVIDNLKKFNTLMDRLAEKPVVAIDTETKNLAKITNQLLTVQFAYNARKGFLVPVSHKDSPFRPKEIRLIQGRLREYFEGANDNQYHIYTNAKFDLTVFRSECGVRYFANPVWDILGGEFCFHPDTQVLTEIGYVRIQDLVHMTNKPRVWSFNIEMQELILKEIIFASEHETDEEMYELEYEGGTLSGTGNHKIWSVTRGAYIRVDEIVPDEEVLILDEPAFWSSHTHDQLAQ